MDPEENHATPFEGFPPLDRDLPEILVERQQDTALRLSEIQEGASDGQRVRLVLVSEVTGVSQAREDVIVRQTRIVCEDVGHRLPGCE